MQLIINQNWFRQWLGKEKTLSHYLSQWWSRPMVHIWVSRIGWVDYFTYWEDISIRRKTVLSEHTRDTFTPIAESGQFRPLSRLGRNCPLSAMGWRYPSCAQTVPFFSVWIYLPNTWSNQLNQSERLIYAPLAWIITDSGNGLVSSLCQAIAWTNFDLWLTAPLRTNCSVFLSRLKKSIWKGYANGGHLISTPAC